MSPSPAPWKKQLLEHIQTLASPTFTFANLTHASPTPSPRIRTLVFRGYYAELPESPHNNAPKNPAAYTSNLLTFTTDRRMEKVRDLGGEGYTGAVETCFWIPTKENPNKGYQWRIRGTSTVLPRKADDKTKSYILSHLHGSADDEFDVDREATAQFGNLSPNIQGSFKQPPPNTPKEKGKQDPKGRGLDLKLQADGLDDEVARDHFRVAVIEAERVEFLDLTKPSKVVWVRVGSEVEKYEQLAEYGEVKGDWREIEMWP